MTEKEYINRKESLEREQRKLDKRFYALDMEYLKSLNDEYAHLLKKKVVITYEEFGYDRYGNRPQKTITCYWNGFRRHKDGYFIPMFKRTAHTTEDVVLGIAGPSSFLTRILGIALP